MDENGTVCKRTGFRTDEESDTVEIAGKDEEEEDD